MTASTDCLIAYLRRYVIRHFKKYFDVEYTYGFVGWGVCKQSRWRHSVPEPSEDSGYVLLWQRYDNKKMVAMRYYVLHLQQYSHRLNLLYFIVFFWVMTLCVHLGGCLLMVSDQIINLSPLKLIPYIKGADRNHQISLWRLLVLLYWYPVVVSSEKIWAWAWNARRYVWTSARQGRPPCSMVWSAYSKQVNDFQLKLKVYGGPLTILTVRDSRWIHLPPRCWDVRRV